MEEYNRLTLLYFDGLVAKILLDNSRQLIGEKKCAQKRNKSDPTHDLIAFVTDKIKPRDRPEILRRLIDFNLLSLAISIARNNSDTVTLLHKLNSTKERLTLRKVEFQDFRELVIKAGGSELINIKVTDANVEDLNKKCEILLTHPDLENPLEAWTAYRNFYHERVDSTGEQFERRVLDLIDLYSPMAARNFFRALEDDSSENCFRTLFSNTYLMILLSKTIG